MRYVNLSGMNLKGGNIRVPKKIKVYVYGMRLRPYDIGCQPDGVVKLLNTSYGYKYHNVICYKEPLSKEEIEHYSLDDLGTLEIEEDE